MKYCWKEQTFSASTILNVNRSSNLLDSSSCRQKLCLKLPKGLTCFFLTLQLSIYFSNIAFWYICHHSVRNITLHLEKLLFIYDRSSTLFDLFSYFSIQNDRWYFCYCQVYLICVWQVYIIPHTTKQLSLNSRKQIYIGLLSIILFIFCSPQIN